MEQSEVQQRAIIDFITLSAEYCRVCNKLYELSPKQFGSFVLKVLPMLYIKVQQLPDYTDYDHDTVEKFVTEEEWKKVQYHTSILMGAYDEYFETQGRFNQPERQTISENIADMYQDLQDFTRLVALGIEDATYEAVGEVKRTFNDYWGQRLVNTLKIVHHLYYNQLLSGEKLLKDDENNANPLPND